MRLLLLAAIALAASCGGPHLGLCEAQVRSGCELRYRCCTAGEELFELGGVATSVYATSEGECVDRLLPTCKGLTAALDEAVALGRLDFDEEKGDECRALLEDARDSCDLSIAAAAVSARRDREGPCALVSVGLVEDGEDCAANLECRDGGFCAFEDPSVPDVDGALGALEGSCLNPGQEGESCSERACVEPLRCDGVTCRAPPGEGEACPDFFCDVDLLCEAGTCTRLPGEGQPCALQCRSGTYCEATVEPNLCELQKGPGDPCSNENFNECRDGDGCVNGRCPGGAAPGLCEGRP